MYMDTSKALDVITHHLDTREDVNNLARSFDLQGLQYLDVQAVQHFHSAMVHWPLLMETIQSSLVDYEPLIKPLPAFL
ncbi:hypothetical protein EGJ50_23565 [Pseudomonas luteola]|nr:hypothetical protein EGJ50_23565 [Pseudomonas luteola]